MRRGMRASTSTDSVIPSRMGIPTACFTSLNRHKGLSNYHSPTDVPENLSYRDDRLRRRPRRGGRARASIPSLTETEASSRVRAASRRRAAS